MKRPLYIYLLGTNIAVYMAYKFGFMSQRFYINNFTLSKHQVETFRLHTFITYAFAHMDIWHLLFNMVGLFFFGKIIEQRFGSRTLLNLYVLGALMGAFFIASQNSRRSYYDIHLGASTSICAILSFFILNFPNETIILYFIPVPAWLVGVILGIQTLVMYDSRNGVSYSGHLGGLVSGVAFHFWMRRKIM